jgi:hypothetical protein
MKELGTMTFLAVVFLILIIVDVVNQIRKGL